MYNTISAYIQYTCNTISLYIQYICNTISVYIQYICDTSVLCMPMYVYVCIHRMHVLLMVQYATHPFL